MSDTEAIMLKIRKVMRKVEAIAQHAVIGAPCDVLIKERDLLFREIRAMIDEATSTRVSEQSSEELKTLRDEFAMLEVAPKPKQIHRCSKMKSPDTNVEKNRQLLLDRSIVGKKKYGMTTCTNPLTHKQWLRHALEEALDMANYLQAAITEIERQEVEDAKK
jgi:vacuolar-type H+-ATPase subunit D/Vma8